MTTRRCCMTQDEFTIEGEEQDGEQDGDTALFRGGS